MIKAETLLLEGAPDIVGAIVGASVGASVALSGDKDGATVTSFVG